MRETNGVYVSEIFDSPEVVRNAIVPILQELEKGRMHKGLKNAVEAVREVSMGYTLGCSLFSSLDYLDLSDASYATKMLMQLRSIFQKNLALVNEIESCASFEGAWALIKDNKDLMTGMVSLALLTKAKNIADKRRVIECEKFSDLPDHPIRLMIEIEMLLNEDDLTHDDVLAKFRGLMNRFANFHPKRVQGMNVFKLRELLKKMRQNQVPQTYIRLVIGVLKKFDPKKEK